MTTILTDGGHDSRAVANRFVELAEAEGKPITVVSLVEYVYLAHAWHLGLFHQPLIFHDVEVLEHGPLIVEVFDAFCPDFPKSVRDPVEAVPGYTAAFTRDEEMIITKTYNHYSKMSQETTWGLICRSGTPFDKARERGYRSVIPDSLIEDYYAGLFRNRHNKDDHER